MSEETSPEPKPPREPAPAKTTKSPGALRGPQKRLTQVDVPPPDFVKYLPYVAAVVTALALVFTIARSPAHALTAATVLGVALLLAMGYVAWGHVVSVAPDDSFRKVVMAVSVLAPLAVLAPFVITLYPLAPQGTVTLARVGDTATLTVRGSAETLYIETQSAFVPDLGSDARARYALDVSRGNDREEVLGTFQRTTTADPAGGRGGTSADVTASRHQLTKFRGPGTYTIALGQFPATLRPPMRVSMSAEPFAPWMLGLLFGLVALAVLVVDARIARRGVESAFAAALLFPMAAVFYLHGHFTRATLGDDLLAAGLVGLLAGGLGGELLARVTRSVVK
jgi:hypothetical protein